MSTTFIRDCYFKIGTKIDLKISQHTFYYDSGCYTTWASVILEQNFSDIKKSERTYIALKVGETSVRYISK